MSHVEPVINLGEALAALKPTLHELDYVFCNVGADGLAQVASIPELFAAVREDEGWTAILPAKAAEAAALKNDTVRFARITLHVHSSLLSVGLSAVLTGELADAGIACNIVAAAYHDHLFVPATHAAQALEVLQTLSGDTHPSGGA